MINREYQWKCRKCHRSDIRQIDAECSYSLEEIIHIIQNEHLVEDNCDGVLIMLLTTTEIFKLVSDAERRALDRGM